MSQDITLSPFYHSAVNAVTKPNQITHVSQYFIDRWMPLLGGNGTLIVLALRRNGFLNRKTGELRDEIVIDRLDLARAAGLSYDTLARELGTDKKTGKPRNEYLGLFVQRRTRYRRDKMGRIRQEENAYWVAMDDPVHPDDWARVEQAVREAEARTEKAIQPASHCATPVRQAGQTAAKSPQNAKSQPQNASASPQSATALKTLDSSRQKTTLQDAASPPGDSLSLFSEQKEPPHLAGRRILDTSESAFARDRRARQRVLEPEADNADI